ncbi:MAG TPA: DUF6266 family protein [Pedobacter sp.]|uniref:DUF6266 family protein n=1 Tax=Pedobacter sp. TaxID=1411316 RepID=UPI002BFB7510|nr:DUF6266 family protein [Pedobacter sp.]HMI02790.1 DUF6266 family protein [Pedobacter sp.]
MARLLEGIFGPIIGKLANTVGYVRKGQAVIRMTPRKPKRKKARTPAQQAVNLKFKLVKAFISVINGFTNVGFKLDVEGTTKIAQNNAVSYNIKDAIKGEFPDFELDYSKIIVSKGKLMPPLNPTVELGDDQLKIKWEINPGLSRERRRDQVMMLAYLPVSNETSYVLSGARRTAGEDVLEIDYRKTDHYSQKKDTSIEVYVAFIADDRESISDSVYAGRIEL